MMSYKMTFHNIKLVNKMNLLVQICFIFIFVNLQHKLARAQTEGSARSQSSKKITFKQPPLISKGQYTYFFGEDYHTFTTKKIGQVAYSDHCFKTAKPDCEAIRLSSLKNITIKIDNPEMRNFASAYCSEIYGKNMIVFDHDKKEYNFCRFEDGSLVASWSLYNLKKPKIVIDYKK